MICADFFQQKGRFHVCICGHAGFAPAGKDIICSAASVLGLTLLSRLQQEEEEKSIRLAFLRQEPGWLQMEIIPGIPGMEHVSEMLKMTEEGFWLLAQQYPEFVKLRGCLYYHGKKIG